MTSQKLKITSHQTYYQVSICMVEGCWNRQQHHYVQLRHPFRVCVQCFWPSLFSLPIGIFIKGISPEIFEGCGWWKISSEIILQLLWKNFMGDRNVFIDVTHLSIALNAKALGGRGWTERFKRLVYDITTAMHVWLSISITWNESLISVWFVEHLQGVCVACSANIWCASSCDQHHLLYSLLYWANWWCSLWWKLWWWKSGWSG